MARRRKIDCSHKDKDVKPVQRNAANARERFGFYLIHKLCKKGLKQIKSEKGVMVKLFILFLKSS